VLGTRRLPKHGSCSLAQRCDERDLAQPSLGSAAIRQYWQRGAGRQREVAVRMGPPIITDDRVAVEWCTTMIDPDESEIALPGCLLQIGGAQRRIVVRR
jgi:hypothetical protein